jgi:hypothetical protein
MMVAMVACSIGHPYNNRQKRTGLVAERRQMSKWKVSEFAAGAWDIQWKNKICN